jgi:hypothetical protein
MVWWTPSDAGVLVSLKTPLCHFPSRYESAPERVNERLISVYGVRVTATVTDGAMKLDINKLSATPLELDIQSRVKIDKWLDIDSEECKDKDPDITLTKKWLRSGAENNFLFVDTLGRIWGTGDNGYYFPYHFEYGKKVYGFRLAVMASN